MFGAFPGHAQSAEGHPNGFIADQPRREPLSATALGGKLKGPPAGRLAEGPWTLVQQRPEGLADLWGEDGRRRVRTRRERMEHRETALVEGMNGIADRWVGTVQLPGNRGGRLAFGTGEKDLATTDGKGGRGPETGLQGDPLVRRERAYK